MRDTRVRRRWVQVCLIRVPAANCLRHLVVNLQDHTFGLVLPVFRFILAANDREGVHDVVDIVAGEAIEVEEGGVQLAAQQEASLGVPAERRAVVPAVGGEGLQVPRGVCELKDAFLDVLSDPFWTQPRAWVTRVERRRKRRELLHIVIGEIGPTDLLPGDVVKRKRVQLAKQKVNEICSFWE